MKKQLLVCLMALVYLVFCCAGLGFVISESGQEAVHFVHADGHSDEYHGAIPGKIAIKAFFAKPPLKAKVSSFCINPGLAGHKLSNDLLTPTTLLNNYIVPTKEARYLHHCTFLL